MCAGAPPAAVRGQASDTTIPGAKMSGTPSIDHVQVQPPASPSRTNAPVPQAIPTSVWLAVLAGYVLVITTTLALSDAARAARVLR